MSGAEAAGALGVTVAGLGVMACGDGAVGAGVIAWGWATVGAVSFGSVALASELEFAADAAGVRSALRATWVAVRGASRCWAGATAGVDTFVAGWGVAGWGVAAWGVVD